MKKMITLLVATGFITIAFAQNGQYDHRDQQYNNGYQNQQNNGYQGQPNVVVVHNDRHFDDHMMYRERDEQVARINHEFDWKINVVRNRWFIGHDKRNWEIHNLEMQKQQQLNDVFARYNGRGDFHHDGFAQGRHW